METVLLIIISLLIFITCALGYWILKTNKRITENGLCLMKTDSDLALQLYEVYKALNIKGADDLVKKEKEFNDRLKARIDDFQK